jgi:hypothetical protein
MGLVPYEMAEKVRFAKDEIRVLCELLSTLLGERKTNFDKKKDSISASQNTQPSTSLTSVVARRIGDLPGADGRLHSQQQQLLQHRYESLLLTLLFRRDQLTILSSTFKVESERLQGAITQRKAQCLWLQENTSHPASSFIFMANSDLQLVEFLFSHADRPDGEALKNIIAMRQQSRQDIALYTHLLSDLENEVILTFLASKNIILKLVDNGIALQIASQILYIRLIKPPKSLLPVTDLSWTLSESATNFTLEILISKASPHLTTLSFGEPLMAPSLTAALRYRYVRHKRLLAQLTHSASAEGRKVSLQQPLLMDYLEFIKYS